MARAPFTLRAGLCGLAALYRYGAVVCFDLTREEQLAFLNSFAHRTHFRSQLAGAPYARVSSRHSVHTQPLATNSSKQRGQ